MNVMRKALDIVLPPRCVVSGQEVDEQGMIAPDIWSRLRFITAPYCKICSLPFEYEVEADTVCAGCIEEPPSYDLLRSALAYDDVSREMVLKFKHGDQMHNVRAFLPWLSMAGRELIEQADMIVPVPLYRWRLLKRRYNQAAILALALAKREGKSCVPQALLRTRATVSQGHLKQKERAANVKQAFAIHPKYERVIKGKNILLIDDVYTTGATVNECAKVLKKAGAEGVNVLTLTRVVR